MTFGATDSATGSRIPGRNGSVRVWSIDRYTDLHGNYTEVLYEKGTAGDYYPTTIQYTWET
jgi:hypothetical protein